jgi:hypothetical protein
VCERRTKAAKTAAKAALLLQIFSLIKRFHPQKGFILFL